MLLTWQQPLATAYRVIISTGGNSCCRKLRYTKRKLTIPEDFTQGKNVLSAVTSETRENENALQRRECQWKWLVSTVFILKTTFLFLSTTNHFLEVKPSTSAQTTGNFELSPQKSR